MSTATLPTTMTPPPPLEIPSGAAGVPPLEVVRWLTSVPEQRVVIHGVDRAFYEALVDSIPEGANIHVDYDGRDLEITGKGPKHEGLRDSLGDFVKIVAAMMGIACRAMGETTWERPEIARGLESDRCFYFSRKKPGQYAAARKRDSNRVADYPDLDLAIEVDISRPEVDRAGIYAALRVPELWRLVGNRVVIERLTPQGTYEEVDSSGFLPVRAEDVRRWVLEEDTSDQSAWAERLRAEMKQKARRLARAARRWGDGE